MANLRTQGDIIDEFLIRMNQSTTVGFYTDAILTKWATNAHSWAAGRYKWPMTEGKYSTTSASLFTTTDGFTALVSPEGYRSESIRLLAIGGKRFDKKNFYKFQSFLEDNQGDSSTIFTDRGGLLLINPNASGISGSVVVYGQFVPPALASDNNIQDPSATTIFTDVDNDANEAIVEKMMSYAMIREKSPSSVFRGKTVNASGVHAQNAQAILDSLWQRIRDEQYAYQDTRNDGMFERFDVIEGGVRGDLINRDQFGW